MFRIGAAVAMVATAVVSFWASLDRPLTAPDWSGPIKGLSYSPAGLYSEADKDKVVSEAVLRRDLEQLAKVTPRIRTYEMSNGRDRIPAIAKDLGLKVSLGIWLSGDSVRDELETTLAINAANAYPGVVDRVFVGNEVVGVRGELEPRELVAYIKRVRAGIRSAATQVGTADIWGTFLKHPELADGADFIAIHLLPYWEGVTADDAMSYVLDNYARVQARHPGKQVVIGETGWPSEGRIKQASVPSPALQAQFLRRFLTVAEARGFDYYIIEAFDQPWKGNSGLEGAVGAFWGVFDAVGAPKFAFAGPLSSFPEWRGFAAATAVAAVGLGLLVLLLMPAMTIVGAVVMAATAAVITVGAALIYDASSLEYVSTGTLVAVALIVPIGAFAALLLLTEVGELALSLWRKHRLPAIAGRAEAASAPLVSIHVPTHDEPLLMVMQTLNALSRLDYPNFEVILLDNNTKDESLWRPVMSHCEALGPRFRFYHLDGVKGFKAGALNKALALTNPDAKFVAVIDSDYQVAPDWLSKVMPGFADENVAIVQAPQDYRDSWENMFKSFLFEEYTAFFKIGMVERNEHNAIIQHGTMCVIRRQPLEQVGGWAEWCITEDTELGLRLFEAGYTALYASESMGRGLMPDTFSAYKGQRYRWVYGAMQILKRHAREVFLGRRADGRGASRLSLAQRYHFVAGWLPWFADSLALVFAVLALGWTALMAIAPKHFDVPLAALSGVALLLFTGKTLKTVVLHGIKVGSGVRGSLASALTGLSLSYTVGHGVLTGLFTSGKPFLRTPKCEDSSCWRRALKIAAAETGFLAAVVVAMIASAFATHLDDPAEWVWQAALAVMLVPFAASTLVAFGLALKLGRRPALQPDIGPVPVLPPPKLDIAA
jgi:exo-beta-1,3-glucanase (GH17 family)/cellulose synthase/poly-beta-1,6-N-acetylglucosamine synthase-like glycosyltransferase